jgi:predicted metal-dependent enzyme (double-stranded beta helix superfamily)
VQAATSNLLPAVGARPSLSGVELLHLVGRIAADTAWWQSRVCLPESEERWWTRLHSDAAVDVWLLSWLPGSTTELHDHGGSTAAFTVVRGTLREVRLDRKGARVVKRRRTESSTIVSPRVIHDVNGTGDEAAVSIHAYSPRLTTMNYYTVDWTGRPQLIDTAEVDGPER